MTLEQAIFTVGDLVYYIGPPVLNPIASELIVENDNRIINRDDIGIIIRLDSFLNIANIFFQHNEITLERVSCKHLKHIE